jgi:uncharacterized protein
VTGAHAWRSLLFVHWEIPADELRPLIPPELTLDTFDGKAYVGLVPFTMPMVKPIAALPVSLAFHETNVRTYVRHGDRSGVWFLSLDAASTLAVWGARILFHLPYFRSDMTLDVDDDGDGGGGGGGGGGEVSYRSERRRPKATPAACALRCRRGALLGPAAPGTLAHFFVERYSLYSRTPRGQLTRGDVHHRPYQLRAAEIVTLEESLLAAAGLRRPAEVSGPVLFCDGVDVEVTGPHRG